MAPSGIVGLALAAALLLGACRAEDVPDTRIGINRPAAGSAATLTWTAVPSASAYQVLVALSRDAVAPVAASPAVADPRLADLGAYDLAAVSGFTSETRLGIAALAWQPGHPIAGRPYFWFLRAYDRPDPQGVLLFQSQAQPLRSVP